MNTVADWLFVLLWLVGVVGSFIPVLPATWIILGGALLQGLLTGFSELTAGVWVWLAVLALGAMFLDNVAAAVGAKRYGAGSAGIWGAIIGGVLGIFILPPVGLLLLPFVGAFVAELLAGQNTHGALRAAWGTLVGMLGGMFIKLVLHVAMGIVVIRSVF